MLNVYLFSLTTPLSLINPLIPRTVNVVIFFGLLFYLLRKPVRQFFTERFAQIRASLERAAKEKEAIQAKIHSIDDRLAQLDHEVARIQETSREEAAAEAARIKAQTQMEIAKIRDVAQREIEAAKQGALIELRQATAVNAVNLAEQLIRRELTPTDDAALLQRASSELKM